MCADEMLEHFDVPAVHEVMTWDNHRWIRLRSTLAAVEKMVDSTLLACDQPENNDTGYEDWLKSLDPDPSKAPSYDLTKQQIAAALKTISKMREIQQVWGKSSSAAAGSPRPRPELRPRAQI